MVLSFLDYESDSDNSIGSLESLDVDYGSEEEKVQSLEELRQKVKDFKRKLNLN